MARIVGGRSWRSSDVGDERDALRIGGQVADERPRVEELGVVGVVLDGEVVETGAVGWLGQPLFVVDEFVDGWDRGSPRR